MIRAFAGANASPVACGFGATVLVRVGNPSHAGDAGSNVNLKLGAPMRAERSA